MGQNIPSHVIIKVMQLPQQLFVKYRLKRMLVNIQVQKHKQTNGQNIYRHVFSYSGEGNKNGFRPELNGCKNKVV